MRSPIQDDNAGAATDVAPAKAHATRTATVAKNHGNSALLTAQNINKAASALGAALDTFMVDKRNVELEQRYQQAYHDQGTKEGLSEYQKDLKRTGFTEFIYGGQSPEYLGALNASARNAANAMFLEELTYMEGEGGDLTPKAYQQRMRDKVTEYIDANFADAPDASMAFMQNWRENSNELSKQQFKLYQVREQEKARRTVANGWQTDLDVRKKLINVNPEKAVQIGKDMFSLKYKPQGMSEAAYWDVIIQESFNAARSGDISAFQLLNDSGLPRTFDDKRIKEYNAVQAHLDTDNFNMLEAARLKYETAVETGNGSQVAAARDMYNNATLQIAARDTGSTKHWKTVYGSDRWRGVLGNQYKERLKKEAKEYTAAQVEKLVRNETGWERELWRADAADRRAMLAERLDDLALASYAPDLDPEVRKNLQKQFIANQQLLERWDSEAATRKAKEDAKIKDAEDKQAALDAGVESLLSGKGFTVFDNKSRKEHLHEAVSQKVNSILPDADGTVLEKLDMIWRDPGLTDQLLRTVGGFGMAVGDADAITTSIRNLSMNLRADNENHKFTPEQKQNANALVLLQERNANLYNAAFPDADTRAEIATLVRGIETGAHIDQTLKILNDREKSKGLSKPLTVSPDKLIMEMNLPYNTDPELLSMAVDEYKAFSHLGHYEAKQAAQKLVDSQNVKIDGKVVLNAHRFEKLNDLDLQSVMQIMDQKIVLDDGSVITGWTQFTSSLSKTGTDANQQTLYTLRQLPNVKLRVRNNQLILTQDDGRVVPIPRDSMTGYINVYRRYAESIKQNNRRTQ